MAGDRGDLLSHQREHRYRPEGPLLPDGESQFQRYAQLRWQSKQDPGFRPTRRPDHERGDLHKFAGAIQVVEPAGELRIQFRDGSSATATASSASSAASAASGDADVPGWLGDPGDGYVPGTAAAASAAACGARRTRQLSDLREGPYCSRGLRHEGPAWRSSASAGETTYHRPAVAGDPYGTRT